MQNRGNILKSVVIAALAYVAVRFFGPLPSLIGYGVGFLVFRLLGKSHPNDNVPLIAGIVVGVVVSLATGLGFAVLLYNM